MDAELPAVDAVPPPAADHAGEIAGFWRRWFAFALDGLLMGIAGALLGFFMYDALVNLGGWGRLVGFVIAFIYFGLWNSRLNRGQTPGEIVMKIRVVARDGGALSVGAAFLRSLVFAGPYFLNGAAFSLDAMQNMLIMVPLSFLIFGVMLGDAYLFTFNRRTRQTVHDLLSGAFVVRAGDPQTPPRSNTMWRGHLVVVGLIYVLSLGLPFLGKRLADVGPFQNMMAVIEALSHEPGVTGAHVSAGGDMVSSVRTGTTTNTNFVAQLVVNPVPADKATFADKAAAIVFANYPEAEKKDRVIITLTHGFDIGIATSWSSQGFSHTPAEWHQRLAPKTDANPGPATAPAPSGGQPAAEPAKQ